MALFFRLKDGLKTIAFCSLIMATVSQAALAETSKEVKQQLQAVKENTSQLESNIKENSSALAALKAKIAIEAEKIAPKKAEVAEAQAALQQAKANAADEPSPENNSRVRNAELTLALTERRTERASATLTEMQEEAAKLEEQIAADTKAKQAAEAKASTLSQKITSLSAAEIQAAKDKALEEQAAREALEQELIQAKAALEKMKQEQAEAEAAAAEAAKKAEAERQALEALKAAEAEKLSLENNETSPAELALQEELESAAVEEQRIIEQQEQVAKQPDINTPEGYALFHHQKLLDALKETNQSRASRSTGNFLRILNNGRTKTYQWKYATRELWTLEAPVNDGENTFSVGRLRVNKDIAPLKGEQMYIFQYDNNNPEDLIMYRKELVE